MIKPTKHLTVAILCLTVLVCHQTAQAQRYVEQLGLRVQGGALLSQHSADFTQNAEVLSCGDLANGTGLGWIFEFGFDAAITDDFGIGVLASYADRSGSFAGTNVYPARDPFTGSEETVTTELELLTSNTFLELGVDLRIPLIGTYTNRILGFNVGPRVGLPLTSRFAQTETIVSPADATFILPSGERYQERTIQDQAFTTRTAVMIGATAGVETLIPLSKTTALSAQLLADYFFNDVVIDAPWRMIGIRGELGLRFSMGKTIQGEPVNQTFVPPPPGFAPPRVYLETSAFAGEVVTGEHLRATVPIVNAVFFDSASAEIPPTYRRTHDGSIMSTNPVEAHSWLLTRVATIVQENPDARIRLYGASSNQPDAEGVALAEKRVNSVRDAFVALGISKSEITINHSTAPRFPSNSEFAGGRAENRRVDIELSNAPLQRWVNTEDFAELHGSIGVSARVIGGDPDRTALSVVRVSVLNTDTTLSQQNSQAKVEFVLPLQRDSTTAKISVLAASGGMQSQLDTLVDVNTLPRRVINLRTNQFEACLRFEYNSSDLTENVQGLLSQLVQKLPSGSTISILGSADNLGSDARNKKLSEERATNTEQYIQSLSGNKFKIRPGTKTTKLSEDTPQGRFLNRSIWITVTTPE